MMLHVEIDPLDGSPPITDAIDFSANTNLGTMFSSAAQSANDYAAVWLNSTSTGIVGTGVIGAFSVTLPRMSHPTPLISSTSIISPPRPMASPSFMRPCRTA